MHGHTPFEIVRADRPDGKPAGHHGLGQIHEEARHIRLESRRLLERVATSLQRGDDVLLGVEHSDSELGRGSGVFEPAEHLGRESGTRRIDEQRQFTG